MITSATRVNDRTRLATLLPFNDFHFGDSQRSRLVSAVLAMLALVVAPMSAQVAPTPGEDAATVPRGLIRLRVAPSWTRITDQWIVRDGSRVLVPLGGALTSDSLGVAELPALAPVEAQLRTLTGLPSLRLNLGPSTSAASVRTVVTPIVVEYGLTDRLTLGVNVPLVQTRARYLLRLDRDTAATVGINPAIAGGAAVRARNESVAAGLGALSLALEQRLKSCRAPSPPASCGTILQNAAEVESLAARASATATMIRALYGSSATSPGAAFVPAGATQRLVIAAIDAIVASAAALGVTAGTVAASTLGGATGPAGVDALTGLYTGYDSLMSSSRIGVGDIEVGAKLLLIQSKMDSARTRGARLAVSGLARFGTGATTPDSPFLPGTGDGQMDVEVAAHLDAFVARRLALTVGGRYATQLGESDALRPNPDGSPPYERSLARAARGSVVAIELAPRLRISRLLSLDGHYAMTRSGATTYGAGTEPSGAALTIDGATVHRAGFGASYSTLEAWAARQSNLPVEVIFSHLATVASGGGPAVKSSRQQLQIRVYFGRRSRVQ